MLLSIAFIAGMTFGLGLAVSEMINPARVIGFLDVAGSWDPTLAFVMAGALATTAPLFTFILKRPRPLLCEEFYLPTSRKIDARLIIGAAVFGVGWGLAGFCPGPALAGLATGISGVYFFVAAMVAGQRLAGRVTGAH